MLPHEAMIEGRDPGTSPALASSREYADGSVPSSPSLLARMFPPTAVVETGGEAQRRSLGFTPFLCFRKPNGVGAYFPTMSTDDFGSIFSSRPSAQ